MAESWYYVSALPEGQLQSIASTPARSVAKCRIQSETPHSFTIVGICYTVN
jgi:hypothetical protein